MGHTLIPLYIQYERWSERWLREQMRGRFSRKQSRRDAAYRACLELLRRYEVELGERAADDGTVERFGDAWRIVPPSGVQLAP